ncbi:MAG TPA: class I SAM-dependent methyltransferase [Gemmataceae bacterium]|jgi:hypothetical protein
MELEAFRELISPIGQEAIADAAALAPTEAEFLRHFEKLRKRYPAELAKAALETVLLRIRAREKHSNADRLYFTREALEQSSSEAVSKHRAKRFARFGHVLDLCCGIGIDAIELARAGCRVTAIDSDPLRLAMAWANAEACGAAIQFLEGDVLTMPLPSADAAFVDPSRRDGERRYLDPAKYQPPLSAVLARFPLGFPLAAKIAPGVAQEFLASGGRKPPDSAELQESGGLRPPLAKSFECEFISSAGELKECVPWFGELKTARRRATVLPDASLASDELLDDPPPRPVGEFLFDPDAAVIRAGLLPLLCEQFGAAPIDHGVALLTGEMPAESPFADCYRVEVVAPMQVAKLRGYLRERGVGRATILKRAVEIDVNDVRKQLKLTGSDHRHVIFTQSLGKRVAIVANPQAGCATGAISRRPH